MSWQDYYRKQAKSQSTSSEAKGRRLVRKRPPLIPEPSLQHAADAYGTKRAVKKTWKRAKRNSGLRGKAPSVSYSGINPDGKALGEEQNGRVRLQPHLWKALRDPDDPAHDNAMSVLLHEFAHTRQKEGMGRDKAEGLATLFHEKASKRLGYKPLEPSRGYRNLARIVAARRKMLGKDSYMKGQFR